MRCDAIVGIYRFTTLNDKNVAKENLSTVLMNRYGQFIGGNMSLGAVLQNIPFTGINMRVATPGPAPGYGNA